jgi:hypothetical protein
MERDSNLPNDSESATQNEDPDERDDNNEHDISGDPVRIPCKRYSNPRQEFCAALATQDLQIFKELLKMRPTNRLDVDFIFRQLLIRKPLPSFCDIFLQYHPPKGSVEDFYIHACTYHKAFYPWVIELLLKHGASHSHWFYLAVQESLEVTEWFIEKGANINGYIRHGNTPLTGAVSYGAKPIVKLLLENGADVSSAITKNGRQYTALDFAERNRHEEVARILRKAAAEL